ncbi:hypothetical protein BDN70DRAFT_895350 [Pholiota conissans]|uniref:Uncharacterized protein n=1 Tax=Pholiota conissans TaxID=109636 RepID=A0A9P6CT25_9AGAR|nr:hypothetical protein BDN70DRAFT_895350 [Pholiota conissans]
MNIEFQFDAISKVFGYMFSAIKASARLRLRRQTPKSCRDVEQVKGPIYVSQFSARLQDHYLSEGTYHMQLYAVKEIWVEEETTSTDGHLTAEISGPDGFRPFYLRFQKFFNQSNFPVFDSFTVTSCLSYSRQKKDTLSRRIPSIKYGDSAFLLYELVVFMYEMTTRNRLFFYEGRYPYIFIRTIFEVLRELHGSMEDASFGEASYFREVYSDECVDKMVDIIGWYEWDREAFVCPIYALKLDRHHLAESNGPPRWKYTKYGQRVENLCLFGIAP